MGYNFDGSAKLITLTSGTVSFTVKDLYSRWKDWVMISDNSKYIYAFTSVAGDPISATQSIAPYIFLNTVDGWTIRPQESDHELRIEGNLYSLNPSGSMFVPTVGDYTVTVIIERSSAAIAVTVGGIDQATVQAALTAQGYTTTRATNLDNLDVLVSNTGLTSEQATMLLEIYKLMGLDPTKPLVVTPTSRKVPSNGSDINQTISEDSGTQTVTVTRV
jgi:hypothetical protein